MAAPSVSINWNLSDDEPALRTRMRTDDGGWPWCDPPAADHSQHPSPRSFTTVATCATSSPVPFRSRVFVGRRLRFVGFRWSRRLRGGQRCRLTRGQRVRQLLGSLLRVFGQALCARGCPERTFLAFIAATALVVSVDEPLPLRRAQWLHGDRLSRRLGRRFALEPRDERLVGAVQIHFGPREIRQQATTLIGQRW